MEATQLLSDCHFPSARTPVNLAVSGGPDSVGLLLLALASELLVHVHHVDHHARPDSVRDATHVAALCEQFQVPCTRHDVEVPAGANFEARARGARRAVLPAGTLTGHTLDDLAETVLVNMLRGAGLDGLSPMVDDPTKPLRDLRRADLHAFVASSGVEVLRDPMNDDQRYVRNRVRAQLLPLMNDVAARDVAPLLARQARVLFEERQWLTELGADDRSLALTDADCRELRTWPTARLRRWLRAQLRGPDEGDGSHPPSSDEIERALRVVDGSVVATELSGGRRLARRGQRLTLD